jgi:hypothetical protein
MKMAPLVAPLPGFSRPTLLICTRPASINDTLLNVFSIILVNVYEGLFLRAIRLIFSSSTAIHSSRTCPEACRYLPKLSSCCKQENSKIGKMRKYDSQQMCGQTFYGAVGHFAQSLVDTSIYCSPQHKPQQTVESAKPINQPPRLLGLIKWKRQA